MSHLEFITAIPWDVRRGSGCYVGTRTLIEALRQAGVDVALTAPRLVTPIYTATRVLFNETLRWRHFSGDVTIGIDADGYTIAQRTARVPHIACIKGVLGDAVPFERGATRASMALQTRLEAKHARRADCVITVSEYCAGRLAELYGVKTAVVVPELIDLDQWRQLFKANPVASDPRDPRDARDARRFTVLSVCRFYPRKRLDVLLRAVALLRDDIPQLEVRIVGGGPEYQRLRRLSSELRVEWAVRWVGDASLNQLAAEYNRSDVFCLPSVQEGFGIVFLEAMAAGKPIVAARAAAVPEVVRNGILVQPEDPEALADGILRLYRDADLRATLANAGLRDVEQFAMQRVARRFLSEVAKIAPAVKIPAALQDQVRACVPSTQEQV
jgi:glycosyltransferase involved in cell wall biosynthesis